MSSKLVDDRKHDDDNQPPVHRHTRTPDSPARFLEWVGRLDRDIPLGDLSELYGEWQRRRENGEQATLTEGEQ